MEHKILLKYYWILCIPWKLINFGGMFLFDSYLKVVCEWMAYKIILEAGTLGSGWERTLKHYDDFNLHYWVTTLEVR